jgi:type IV pilus assembly protein PilC
MEMRHFFSQLETTIGSGITLGRALHLIGQNLKGWTLKRKVGELERIVTDGGTLSDGMKRVGSPFSRMHISFIKFGEETGCMEKVCGALARHADKEVALSRQVTQAMIYPGFVLLLALIGGPVITSIIKNGGLTDEPLVPALINVGIFAGVVFGCWLLRGVMAKGVIDAILVNIPFIGGVMRDMALSRFARALSVSQFAGVPLVQGIETAIAVSGNPWLESRLKDLPRMVGSGKGIAASLEHSGVLPGTLKEMIVVGEQSGKLPEMLEKTADYYEEEATNRISMVMKVLPVLIFLPVAIYVGKLVISAYQQMPKFGD